jgi:hypothetical protein
LSAALVHASAAALAVVLPTFCGPTPPARRAFPPGRYAYEARLPLPAAPDSVTYRGTLVLDAVTPDERVGRWGVPGYAPQLGDNYFNVVSYHVTARLPRGADTLTLVHSLRRDGAAGGVPACRVAVLSAGASTDGRCTLTRR